jgi:adenylate cyclase class IV
MNQRDTFYHCPEGRLKLRQETGAPSQLIFYHRPDAKAPKASHYFLAPVGDEDAGALSVLLEAAWGLRGRVVKERTLYRKETTRIHLDRVEGLGDFLELEVVLKDGLSHSEGIRIAESLMEALGVKSEDLMPGAYLDLMEGQACP